MRVSNPALAGKKAPESVGRLAEIRATFGRACDRQTHFEKDEFLDVIYWIRQVVGLCVGLLLGLVGWTGITGFLLCGSLLIATPARYYRGFLDVDEEEFGGASALLGEGTYAAMAVFVLSWTLVYSSIRG